MPKDLRAWEVPEWEGETPKQQAERRAEKTGFTLWYVSQEYGQNAGA